MNASTEYVYIFKSLDLYKIGRTKNIEKRLAGFSDSPFLIEFVFAVSITDSRKIEAELHRRFRERRLQREWFSLDDGQ